MKTARSRSGRGEQGGTAVLRAKDLPPFRPISPADFDEICGTFGIVASQRAYVRGWLDDLVWMIASLDPHPERRAERRNIEVTLSGIRRARSRLRLYGTAARAAFFPEAARYIGPMVTAGWIRERFAGESTIKLVEDMHGPLGESLEPRVEFVRFRSTQALDAVLQDIEKALEAALREFALQADVAGGRKPLTSRYFFLTRMAWIWEGLGKRLSVGPRSWFVAFCEAVAEAAGWPTEGLAAAVPSAVREWRDLTKIKAR
jgi:hypothetical protein